MNGRADQPLVSVVTPVYNGAEYLAECIESVFNQTYENWEYVISDNCSTDGSLEIARGYEARDPRIRVVAEDVFVDQLASSNRSLRAISPTASTRRCSMPTTGCSLNASSAWWASPSAIPM